jgi:predicted peroxiredoxin
MHWQRVPWKSKSICTSHRRPVRWLLPGVADAAYTDAERTKTVGDFIREVKAAGVRLFACAMAKHEHARDQALIGECDGHAGAAAVIADAVNTRTRTLVF